MYPEVTIIMPCHNSEKTINKSIESVLNQSYKNWKLLVIDDCSIDMSRDIVLKYCNLDSRVELISLKKWSGVAAARNIGLERADTTYIAFLDSDDVWVHKKLEVQLDFMRSNGTDITFSAYSRVNENGVILGQIMPPEKITIKNILRSNYIGNSTAVIVREKLKSLRFKSIGNEDHLFWIDLLTEIGRPVFSTPSDEPLVEYLVRSNSLSGNKFKSMSYEWNIYKNELNFGFVKSAYYMLNYLYYGILKRI